MGQGDGVPVLVTQHSPRVADVGHRELFIRQQRDQTSRTWGTAEGNGKQKPLQRIQRSAVTLQVFSNIYLQICFKYQCRGAGCHHSDSFLLILLTSVRFSLLSAGFTESFPARAISHRCCLDRRYPASCCGGHLARRSLPPSAGRRLGARLKINSAVSCSGRKND